MRRITSGERIFIHSLILSIRRAHSYPTPFVRCTFIETPPPAVGDEEPSRSAVGSPRPESSTSPPPALTKSRPQQPVVVGQTLVLGQRRRPLGRLACRRRWLRLPRRAASCWRRGRLTLACPCTFWNWRISDRSPCGEWTLRFNYYDTSLWKALKSFHTIPFFQFLRVAFKLLLKCYFYVSRRKTTFSFPALTCALGCIFAFEPR